MHTTILHLSDIHFKVAHSKLTDVLAQKIARSVLSTITSYSKLITVVSGDIAFSGAKEEYDVFKDFYDKMTTLINNSAKCTSFEFVAVPGNHDCDFSDKDQNVIREALLTSFASGNKKIQIANSISKVQKNFFDFLKEMTSLDMAPDNRFFYIIEKHNIKFLCYNTAWCSKLHEQQGQLYFPIFHDLNLTSEDLVVGIHHHPLNWLTAEDAASLKLELDKHCNFVLTGHEHQTDFYERNRDGERTVHFEAGAILEYRPQSIFNVITIDTENRKYKYVNFLSKKEGNFSEINKQTNFLDLPDSKISKKLSLRNDFSSKLLELDSIILPDKSLAFDSLYIYPNLEIIELDKKDGQNEIVKGEEIGEFIRKHRKVAIHGASNSGKTSLSRKLFRDLYGLGYAPILLALSDVKRTKIRDFEKLITSIIPQEYHDIDLNKYMQIDIDKRCIIVDDFDIAEENEELFFEIEKYVNPNFNIIIYISSTDALENVIESMGSNYLNGVVRCEIKGLNPSARSKLMENYLLQTSADRSKNRLFYDRLTQAENTVNTALKTKLISPFPIYVLGIIRHFGDNPNNDSIGSNNFVYDLLVKYSLAKISPNDADVSTIETYLANLAFHKYKTNDKILDYDLLFDFTKNHLLDYYISHISARSLIEKLLEAGIIKDLNGIYNFKHRHLYYYFVALYLKNNMSEAQTQIYIKKLIENLDKSDNVNIMMFLVFLTKDFTIVEDIMSYLEKMISNFKEKNIEDCNTHLIKLSERIPDIIYDDKPVENNREHILSQITEDDEDYNDDKNLENLEVRDKYLKQVVLSLRIMDMLGQIVKNHIGSWEGAKKSLILETCYRTSLKVTGALLNVLEYILEEITTKSVEDFKNNEKIKDINLISVGKRNELLNKTRGAIVSLMEYVCLGLIDKTAKSIGSNRLMPIYSKLNLDTTKLNIKLLNLYVRMNYNDRFPEADVRDIYDQYKNNIFSSRLIQRLVIMHFTFYPALPALKNRMLDALDIQVNRKNLYLQSLKRHEN
ncbi:metallophosphoesterase [Deinococcus misasensis]|uniref:metallophosphoesterase n=1 Tax=Deinococcus misasensis TaxID=392413 RepID=UPI00054ED12C|nr:metallophosphoesterase [Deinococcus misasensis]